MFVEKTNPLNLEMTQMPDRLTIGFIGPCARTRIAALLFVLFTGCAAPKRGILIMAHGGDPGWNRDVEAVVEPVRASYPTEIAFGMAQASSIREAVSKLEAKGVREIAVVRMFVSGDSFVPATEYILGLRDTPPLDPLASRGNEHVPPEPAPAPSTVLGTSHGAGQGAHAEHAGHGASGDPHAGHCMEPPQQIRSGSKFTLSYEGLGESPLVDGILRDRVKSLSVDPARESVLILAHGPGDDAENERWLANMNRRLQQLAEIGPFREIRCETLREDWPQRRQEAERRIRAFVETANRKDGRCLVVPFRVAGFGPYKEVLTAVDYIADERGFCPHPNMTQWIEQTARECWR
jgi:sirohydrochlorin ferrochelatase